MGTIKKIDVIKSKKVFLIKFICPHCNQEIILTSDHYSFYGFFECPKCYKTGWIHQRVDENLYMDLY